MDANALLHLLMRFVHITSIILFLGGLAYARSVLTPIVNQLPDSQKGPAASGAQAGFRATLYTLLVLIVGSGLYNLLAGPAHTKAYHMWFGIKMLLVLHILAASILYATSPYGDVAVEGKGKRRLASILISGLVVVLISNYLRSLTQQGL